MYRQVFNLNMIISIDDFFMIVWLLLLYIIINDLEVKGTGIAVRTTVNSC